MSKSLAILLWKIADYLLEYKRFGAKTRLGVKTVNFSGMPRRPNE
jgi:hypothetical protein